MSVMIPIVLVTGLIYILGQANNYDIKMDELGRDIRVRRETHDIVNSSILYDILTNSVITNDNVIRKEKRKKRQLSFYITKKTNKENTGPFKANYIYDYNNRKYNSNIENKNSNSIAQNNKTPKSNETLIINNLTGNINSYNNWRRNYTWNSISNASRQKYNHYHRYNDLNNPYRDIKLKDNLILDKLTGTNSTYNGFPGYKFNNIHRNFSLPYTIMPKFNNTGFRDTKFYPTQRYGVTGKQNTGHYNHSESYINDGLPKLYNRAIGLNSTNGGNYTLKSYAPGYLPIPEFKGTKVNDNGPHWYNNINVRDENTTVPPPPRILGACVICNIPCPENMHRAGTQCVKDESDY